MKLKKWMKACRNRNFTRRIYKRENYFRRICMKKYTKTEIKRVIENDINKL